MFYVVITSLGITTCHHTNYERLIMQKIDKFSIAALIAIFVLWAWMSNEDYKESLAAEAHAKHVKQLAQQEAAQRKAEFNKLVKRGEYLTGIGSTQQ